jgi:hypothetical protein
MELLLGMYLIYRIEVIPNLIRIADEVAAPPPPQVITVSYPRLKPMGFLLQRQLPTELKAQ